MTLLTSCAHLDFLIMTLEKTLHQFQYQGYNLKTTPYQGFLWSYQSLGSSSDSSEHAVVIRGDEKSITRALRANGSI